MTYTTHYTYSDRDDDQLLISTSSHVPGPLIYIRIERTYYGVYAPTGAEAVRMARALLDATGNRHVRLVDPAAPELAAEDLVEPGDEVPALAELADALSALRRDVRTLRGQQQRTNRITAALTGRIDGLSGRLDGVSGRVDAVTRRLDGLERRSGELFGDRAEQLDTIRRRLDATTSSAEGDES